MTVLRFHGILGFGDSCRVSDDDNGAILIDGVDVIETIANTRFENKVTVAVADERFSGPLAVELGWGYSEWTPVEDDGWKVGEHNLIDIINRYPAGEKLTIWVADGPFNRADNFYSKVIFTTIGARKWLRNTS